METQTHTTIDTIAVYSYEAYDPQLTIELDSGERVKTCHYKQTPAMKAKGIEARDSVYIKVPTAASILTLDAFRDGIEDFYPLFCSLIEKEQDDIIKKAHADGAQQLYATSISLTRVIESWESKGASSLDKEAITAWFNDYVKQGIVNILCDKLGVPEEELSQTQEIKVMEVAQGYLDKFVSLASGRTQPLTKPLRDKLHQLLEDTDSLHTTVGIKINNRLVKMEEKEKEDMASLGMDLDI